MSTIIKRLKLNNLEFVPITVAEAVVVNGLHIWSSDEVITTLDNVLRTLYGNAENINNIIKDINTQLNTKLDTLIPGEGININIVDGKPIISTNLSLYRIVTELPIASALHENKIYLVGNQQNLMIEYICVKDNNGNYYFEQIGIVLVLGDIDLSGYITAELFNLAIGSLNQKVENLQLDINYIQTNVDSINANMLLAVDITDTNGYRVSVDYNIPTDLYDTTLELDNIV